MTVTWCHDVIAASMHRVSMHASAEDQQPLSSINIACQLPVLTSR